MVAGILFSIPGVTWNYVNYLNHEQNHFILFYSIDYYAVNKHLSTSTFIFFPISFFFFLN